MTPTDPTWRNYKAMMMVMTMKMKMIKILMMMMMMMMIMMAMTTTAMKTMCCSIKKTNCNPPLMHV